MFSANLVWNTELLRQGSVPEDFTEEQRMIASLIEDFVAKEILPLSNEIDCMEPGLMAGLLKKAGELGLLGPDVPEQWGGMALDLTSSLLIAEKFGANASFAVSYSDHTALGTLPLVLFGNHDQNARYLPALAAGEMIAAYALTEGGAGSDALAARTKAVLNQDGDYYVLNGSKQFITNAGIADLFITFSNVDGDKFTAFLVDRDSAGLTVEAEEKKMGISGSSTCSVVFEDVKVPVSNILLEIGQGQVVAFNTLNIGRLKLAAQCIGSAKVALQHAANYALERKQFGQPVARFGLIQDKLARMSSLIFIAESMVYRLSARLGDAMIASDNPADVVAAIGQFATECSMSKVFASEVLNLVADETVQVFGGYGYSADYPVERIYRDSRINRIFAGTNEINRLLIAKSLIYTFRQGMAPDVSELPVNELTAKIQHDIAGMKTSVQTVTGLAIDKFGDALNDQQEILALITDSVIEFYAAGSGLERIARAIDLGESQKAALQADMLKIFCNYTVPQVNRRCSEVLAACFEGEELKREALKIDGLTGFLPENGVAIGRHVAERALEAGGYPFN